jgi:hypothetical protein
MADYTPMRSLFVCDDDDSTGSDSDGIEAIVLTRNRPRAVGKFAADHSPPCGLTDSSRGRSNSPELKRHRPEAAETPGTALVCRQCRPGESVDPTQLATPAPGCFTQLEPGTETQEALVADGVAMPSPPPAFPALVDDSPQHQAPSKGKAFALDQWSTLVRSFFDKIDKRPLLTTIPPTSEQA